MWWRNKGCVNSSPGGGRTPAYTGKHNPCWGGNKLCLLLVLSASPSFSPHVSSPLHLLQSSPFPSLTSFSIFHVFLRSNSSSSLLHAFFIYSLKPNQRNHMRAHLFSCSTRQVLLIITQGQGLSLTRQTSNSRLPIANFHTLALCSVALWFITADVKVLSFHDAVTAHNVTMCVIVCVNGNNCLILRLSRRPHYTTLLYALCVFMWVCVCDLCVIKSHGRTV